MGVDEGALELYFFGWFSHTLFLVFKPFMMVHHPVTRFIGDKRRLLHYYIFFEKRF